MVSSLQSADFVSTEKSTSETFNISILDVLCKMKVAWSYEKITKSCVSHADVYHSSV